MSGGNPLGAAAGAAIGSFIGSYCGDHNTVGAALGDAAVSGALGYVGGSFARPIAGMLMATRGLGAAGLFAALGAQGVQSGSSAISACETGEFANVVTSGPSIGTSDTVMRLVNAAEAGEVERVQALVESNDLGGNMTRVFTPEKLGSMRAGMPPAYTHLVTMPVAPGWPYITRDAFGFIVDVSEINAARTGAPIVTLR